MYSLSHSSHAHTYTRTHTHTHTHTHTYNHSHTHTHIHIHIHTHAIIHIHTHVQSHTRTHSHTHSRTHTLTYTLTYTYTHTHSHTHSHTHTHTHTYKHTRTHTRTHTLPYTHTHVYTHTHTHTQCFLPSSLLITPLLVTYWGPFPASQLVWSALSSLATVSCLRSTKRCVLGSCTTAHLYSVMIRSVAWFCSRKVGMMPSHILLSFSLPLTLPILHSHLPCCLLGVPSLPRVPSFCSSFLRSVLPPYIPPSFLPSLTPLPSPHTVIWLSSPIQPAQQNSGSGLWLLNLPWTQQDRPSLHETHCKLGSNMFSYPGLFPVPAAIQHDCCFQCLHCDAVCDCIPSWE